MTEIDKVKQSLEELGKFTRKIAEHGMKSCDDQKKINSNLLGQIDKIINIFEKLIRVIQIIFLVEAVLIIELYFKEAIGKFFELFTSKWTGLSENWQIFIIGIPILVLTELIVHFLIKYLESYRSKTSE